MVFFFFNIYSAAPGFSLQDLVPCCYSVTLSCPTLLDSEDCRTPGFPACQSFTISWSLLKLMSIELMMPSSSLVLCHLLFLLPSIFLSIRVFSNESVLTSGDCSIVNSASASVLSMNIQDWFPIGLTCLISLQPRDSQESSPTPQFESINRSADVEAETLILCLPDAKSWLIWKNPDVGKDWGQEEKGTTEDEMVGWHHQLDGHGFGWTLGVGDGQGGLACCSSWGHKESDTTEQLNWTEQPSLWSNSHIHTWLLEKP